MKQAVHAILIFSAFLLFSSCNSTKEVGLVRTYSKSNESLTFFPNCTYTYTNDKQEFLKGKWSCSGDTVILNSISRPDSIPINEFKEMKAGKPGVDKCIQVYQNSYQNPAFAPIVVLQLKDGSLDSLFWDLSTCFSIPKTRQDIKSFKVLLPSQKEVFYASTPYIAYKPDSNTYRILVDYPEGKYGKPYHISTKLLINKKSLSYAYLANS